MDLLAGGAFGARGRVAPRVGLAVASVGLAGFVFAAAREMSSGGVTRAVAIVVLVVGSVWFACTKRTGLALALLMLYLGLLDGYLKLATGSSTVTLVRDALLYAIVAGLLARSQVEGRRLSIPPLSGWILAYTAFVLVQIANPNAGTVSHSLAGVRPHLEFVPLFFLGYGILRDVASLRRFLVLLIVVGAANGVVGYIQLHLTPVQLAGWGPGYAARINGTGSVSARIFTDAAGVERVRPFGLGSDAGSGGLFGVASVGAVLALSSLVVQLRYRVLAALLGVGVVAAIISSQGRGVIVAAVATAFAYAVMTATSQRRIANFTGLAVIAAVAYFAVGAIVASVGGGDAFRYQGLGASKILQTTNGAQGRHGQLHTIGTTIVDYPLGVGLGTAGPAGGTAGGSALAGTLNAESEYAFLVLEAGIPGMVAVVGFTAVLLGLGLRRCRREPDHEARIFLAAAISPIAGMLVDFYAGPSTVSVPDGPYLWFVGGAIAYWLVALPRERRGARGALA
jgi:hypothetical protein